MDSQPSSRSGNEQSGQPAPRPATRVLNSDDLLQGDREVMIAHHGEFYRLRETRNGKLILIK